MRRVLIALIIHRNRYLISKITEGTFSGQWAFPGGLVHPDESDFDALKQAIKQRLGIDIFPYITLKQLVYRSKDDTIDLTLIKCSITDESKRFLSSKVQREYKWLFLPFVAHIDFAQRDKKIVRHLTNGLFLVPRKRTRQSASKRKTFLSPKTTGSRRKGFASLSKARLSQITSAAGKRARRTRQSP